MAKFKKVLFGKTRREVLFVLAVISLTARAVAGQTPPPTFLFVTQVTLAGTSGNSSAGYTNVLSQGFTNVSGSATLGPLSLNQTVNGNTADIKYSGSFNYPTDPSLNYSDIFASVQVYVLGPVGTPYQLTFTRSAAVTASGYYASSSVQQLDCWKFNTAGHTLLVQSTLGLNTTAALVGATVNGTVTGSPGPQISNTFQDILPVSGTSTNGPYGPSIFPGYSLAATMYMSAYANSNTCLSAFQSSYQGDLTINASLAANGPLSINTSSLPGGKVGSPYPTQTLTASGGTPPYTWSVASGGLPIGLTLAGGAISGTPTSPGTFPFTVQVTDSAGSTATQPLSIQIANIAAPTNLQASQFNCSSQTGCSGTQIQITWDYGTDVIDGFELVRQTPSEAGTNTWEPPTLVPGSNCGPTASGETCTYTDSVPTLPGTSAYATYSYQVRAYLGTDESNYSNTDTAFQLKLYTGANNYGIFSDFEPDVINLDRVGSAFGLNHFNWVSLITSTPYPLQDWFGTLWTTPPPLVDPHPGGWKNRQADFLPYYWDEQAGFDPAYFLYAHRTTTNLQFEDQPFDSRLQATDYIQFTTYLIGTTLPVGANPNTAPPQFEYLASFSWSTNLRAGIDYSLANLAPPPTPASGGIFNMRIIGKRDLPLDDRLALIQLGAQNVPTTPKVDKDAPMTAAFLSGPQGTNGWYTGPVTVTLIATDIDGPSDIASTTYNLDAGSLSAYAGPFTVSGDGIHTIQFGSVDVAGNVETPSPSQTIEIDATPPAFVTFPSSMTVLATSASGAVVTYSLPTATDVTSGVSSAGVSCAPASGSTFTLGTTTVTCSVADNAGNIGTRTFSVTVQKANQTITLTGVPVTALFGQGPLALSGSATSGLTVALSATGNCLLSGNSLSLTGVGSCSVTAAQAGNGQYNAAPTLNPSFTIGQAPTATVASASPATVQYSDYTTLTAGVSPISAGGQTLTGTVQFSLNSSPVGSPVGINSSGVATLPQVQVKLSAGNYTVKAVFSSTNANFSGGSGTSTQNVTQEDAFILYSGDTIAQVGTSLNLRATVWDSAATGYPGVNPESGPTATIGDITKIWIAFDIYPAGSCGSGTPSTLYAQAALTGTPGIGTATTTLSSSSEVSYCVVSRLVAGNTGGTNLFYTAPNAETAGLGFYVNSGQFATGGGWVNDPTGSHGNFGFNARYNSTGSPKGQMVYVFRSIYNGVLADFIIKSNALSALQFSGTTYPISSTLQGKVNVQINRASDGLSLFSAGNYTFSATATDSGQNGATGKQFSLTVYASNGVPYHQVASNTPLQGGNVVVHSQ